MNYKLQTILFPRNLFSEREVENWVIHHKYKLKKIDIKQNYYHVRQLDPSYLKRHGYTKIRSKMLDNGIIFVLYYKE